MIGASQIPIRLVRMAQGVIDAIRESYVIGSKFRNEFHPLARPFEYKRLLPSPTSFSSFH